jgi:hypothetical protein
MEKTNSDVAYGNWYVLYQTPTGKQKFSSIQTFGQNSDIKEALLSQGWLATASPLFRREIVIKAGGWDENIRTVEEKDFHFAVAMAGGVFQYHADLVSVFRRYGAVTLSTSNLHLWTDNAYMLYKKMERILQNKGMLTPRYQEALAVSYYSIARKYYETDPIEYRRALAHARRIYPGFKPRQSMLYNILQEIVGLHIAQRIAYYKRWIERHIGMRRRFV